MTDYRNIQDLDEFDNLVENFVKNRKQLKQKVKEERGDLSRKKADAKLKAKPITESIAELKSSLDKGGFLKMFERFSGGGLVLCRLFKDPNDSFNDYLLEMFEEEAY